MFRHKHIRVHELSRTESLHVAASRNLPLAVDADRKGHCVLQKCDARAWCALHPKRFSLHSVAEEAGGPFYDAHESGA